MLLASSEESESGCDRLYRQVSRVDWLKCLGRRPGRRGLNVGSESDRLQRAAGLLGLCPGREQPRFCSEPWGSEQGSIHLASSREGWVRPQENICVCVGRLGRDKLRNTVLPSAATPAPCAVVTMWSVWPRNPGIVTEQLIKGRGGGKGLAPPGEKWPGCEGECQG